MPDDVRVILLGCVKRKLDRRAAAKELYCSPLWAGRRAYAEASTRPWLILSAKHGVVDPNARLAPYDLALKDLSAGDRRAWGKQVVRGLERRFASLNAITFEIHAGEQYRRAIEPGILERGGRFEVPLARLPLGAQLAWYRDNAIDDTEPTMSRRRTCTRAELRHAMLALDDAPIRIAARDWPAQLLDLDQAGLYSWWVDEAGARELSRGLGHRLKTGRIYAGQTGATKWPSGKVGKATLASRIGGNHLSGRIRGSTFRLTLASALAVPLGLVKLGPNLLDNGAEHRLTEWMRDHLELAVHPFAERDALGDLEHRALARLDPPLNIEGMPLTQLRMTLSGLRASPAA